MICLPCRDDDHPGCPDFTHGRQIQCDCQHKERGAALVVTPGT